VLICLSLCYIFAYSLVPSESPRLFTHSEGILILLWLLKEISCQVKHVIGELFANPMPLHVKESTIATCIVELPRHFELSGFALLLLHERTDVDDWNATKKAQQRLQTAWAQLLPRAREHLATTRSIVFQLPMFWRCIKPNKQSLFFYILADLMLRKASEVAARASRAHSVKLMDISSRQMSTELGNHSETTPSARLAFNLKANPEALRLYREILKTAKKFYWPNEDGEPW
jgi:hypothetical protein